MYRITFYIPESHLDQVKSALFNVGAGRVGNYDCCAWQTAGTGQFRPLDGSHPYSGTIDNLCSEKEFKVEMVCADTLIKKALQTLIEVHPYDTPAYAAYKILTLDDF